MMEDAISARYEWNPDELAEAFAAHRLHSIRPAFRPLLMVLVAFGMLASIGIPIAILNLPFQAQDVKTKAAVSLVVIVIGWSFLIWGFCSGAFLKWKARFAFRSLPSGKSVIEWSFLPEEISVRTVHSAGTILWPAFLKVVETPKGFLLYQSANFFNWIPVIPSSRRAR